MTKRRPSLKSPCNADRYAAEGERIGEFSSALVDGAGGLLSLRDESSEPGKGVLVLNLYRLENVRVHVDAAALGPQSLKAAAKLYTETHGLPTELRNLLNRAAAALETPDDLHRNEVADLIEDLTAAAGNTLEEQAASFLARTDPPATWEGGSVNGWRDRMGGITIRHEDGSDAYVQPDDDAEQLAADLDACGGDRTNIAQVLIEYLEP